MSEERLKYFLFEIFPFCLAFLGFFSSLFVIIIFSRKKLNALPGKNLLKILALIDFLCCLCSFNRVFESALMNHSVETCTLITFSFYMFPTTSSSLLGYISIEKLLTIKKPLYKNMFAKKKYQICVCIGIFLLNASLYSSIFTLNDIYRVQFIWSDLYLNQGNGQSALILYKKKEY